ncbi:MAG: acetyl-CoA C-acyltransferase [Candidatus Eisenbacteria bacterium]|uniref:Acetyl-CoA C-acyltransferase n=2 Tax=Eiseniibacteriota bacterium TaxID=2212470 RepID=A0A538SA59_UNCEI|nr:MAG: acetyl-CoA C-acyltransferase [Candidatus Eisenbacteria bacterium]
MTEWVGGRAGNGKPGGALKDVSAIDLGVAASKAALERSNVPPDLIDHVVMGNALQTSGDALYGARHVALKAGVPVPIPALTVNRLCGSGIQSVISGAQMILLGEANFVLAGGIENLSQAPFVIRGARSGIKLGQGALEDSLMVALRDSYCGCYMAQTSDNLARRYKITREEQDQYAFRSITEGRRAIDSCLLSKEIVPVTPPGREAKPVEKDDHCFEGATLEGLAKLPPAFGKESFVTAGNASGIVDGAAALVITSARHAEKRELHPMGRIASWATVGVDPDQMGIGPVPATRAALKQVGLTVEDVDLFEINEAFAGQYLAVEKELGNPREKTNVNGGAIALGHPLAATGTRLILTLLYELRRRKKRWGVASACIGGGQGIAAVVEAMP